MASILTSANIQNAISAVDSYVSTATGLFNELETTINNLTASNFMGDASNGYKEFFTKQATPALTTNLTDPSASLTASIKNMLESIKEQLLDTVDPQLGDNNRNPGGVATKTV